MKDSIKRYDPILPQKRDFEKEVTHTIEIPRQAQVDAMKSVNLQNLHPTHVLSDDELTIFGLKMSNGEKA